jgi:hypothetical protein
MDSGQARVAGGHAVAPFGFQVVEEAADERGVDVGDRQRRGCFAEFMLGVVEQ